MPASDADSRDRILAATSALLAEAAQPERITVRQIAERAEVGIGAINYHFGSKDALLNEAVAALMAEEAGRWLSPSPETADAETRLRSLLQRTSQVAMRFEALARISASYALLHGDYGVERMVLPLLRELLGGRMSEIELRLTAIQLIATLQVLLLRADDAAAFTGMDVRDEEQMTRAIDRLIDNVIG